MLDDPALSAIERAFAAIAALRQHECLGCISGVAGENVRELVNAAYLSKPDVFIWKHILRWLDSSGTLAVRTGRGALPARRRVLSKLRSLAFRIMC